MKRKGSKNPKPEAARVDMGEPLVVDAAPEAIAAPVMGSDCLVVFCKGHTHKGKQYGNGDSLKVSPLVRDKLRLFEAIH